MVIFACLYIIIAERIVCTPKLGLELVTPSLCRRWSRLIFCYSLQVQAGLLNC